MTAGTTRLAPGRTGICRVCEGRIAAGSRGPLPEICSACAAHSELRYRITSARRLATRLGRRDIEVLLTRVETLAAGNEPGRRP